MRADAGEADVEAVGARHHRPAVDGEGPRLHAWPVVHAEHRLHREALEEAVGDHRRRAALALLGGLEDQVDRAVEVAPRGERLGRAEQHGGVAVVAAGVHAAVHGRFVRELVALGDRQRVHVGAQADRAQAAAAAHHADHAGAADAAVGLDAERLKVARDQLGGAVLLEGELGVGVDVAADRGQLALQGADAFDEAHGCTVLLWFVAGVRV